MNSTPRPRPARTSVLIPVIGTLLHAGLILGLLVEYVWYVPWVKRTCDEAGLTLSWVTQTIIKVSYWLADYWWTAIPVLALLLVADFAVIFWLGRKGKIVLPLLWIMVGALLLIVVGIATTVPLMVSMQRANVGLVRN